MKLARRAPRRARIEIIPMIDTVFFLLVFFMMASLSMTISAGLAVDLPRAESAQPSPDQNAAITLTRDGRMSLNREPIDRDALSGRLRTLLAANQSLVLVINADADVVHARVVQVMDAARQAGVTRMAIAVEPNAEARRP